MVQDLVYAELANQNQAVLRDSTLRPKGLDHLRADVCKFVAYYFQERLKVGRAALGPAAHGRRALGCGSRLRDQLVKATKQNYMAPSEQVLRIARTQRLQFVPEDCELPAGNQHRNGAIPSFRP